MKYRIHTLIVLLFFILVFFGLAFNHFTEDNDMKQAEITVETGSPELHTIMRLLLSDMDRISEGIYAMDFRVI